MTATHQHQATLTRWNWATDRIEQWCSCGLKLADDIDEASYGPAFAGIHLETVAAAFGPPNKDCGQSWLIDLGYGLAVFAVVFLAALTWLLLLA